MFFVELSRRVDAEANDGNAPINPIPASVAPAPVIIWRRVAAGNPGCASSIARPTYSRTSSDISLPPHRPHRQNPAARLIHSPAKIGSTHRPPSRRGPPPQRRRVRRRSDEGDVPPHLRLPEVLACAVRRLCAEPNGEWRR